MRGTVMVHSIGTLITYSLLMLFVFVVRSLLTYQKLNTPPHTSRRLNDILSPKKITPQRNRVRAHMQGPVVIRQDDGGNLGTRLERTWNNVNVATPASKHNGFSIRGHTLFPGYLHLIAMHTSLYASEGTQQQSWGNPAGF
jgi:hypothetical protein